MSAFSELTALADAIRVKSGVSGKLSLVGMTEAVNDIRIESGDIDFEGVNVYAGVLLTGFTAVNATGNKINGSMPIAPEATVRDGTVTIPKGYNAEEYSVTVTEANSPTVKGNAVTFYPGYNYAGDTIFVGNPIGGFYITPGTADQTISADSYIQYDIIIKGDANLRAENIKKDVTIFGVTGTHEGGSGGADIDFEGVTVTASDLLSGVVAIDANGNKVTGNIQTVIPDVVDNVITIPRGFLAEQKIITVGTVKAAETITPGTANQSIPAGTYLTGTQLIKGDANLQAENIKKDVTIFGVTGTHEGGSGGSGNIVKVTAYTPYKPAVTAITEVTISGIELEEYSDANGEYIAVDDTFTKYKHESADYWLSPRHDEYDEWGGDGWQLTTSADSEWGSLYCMPLELKAGSQTSMWYFEDWGEEISVTLRGIQTTTPEQEEIIEGIKAEVIGDVLYSGDNSPATIEPGGITPIVNHSYLLTEDNRLLSEVARVRCKPDQIFQLIDVVDTIGAKIPVTNQGRGTISEGDGSNTLTFNNAYMMTDVPMDIFNRDFRICIYWDNPYANGRKALCAAFEGDGIFGVDTNGDTPNMWAGNSGWNILNADDGWSPDPNDSSGRGSINKNMMHPNGGISVGDKNRYIPPNIDIVRKGDEWSLYVGGVLSVRKKRSGKITARGVLALARWGNGDLMTSNVDIGCQIYTSAEAPSQVKWAVEHTDFSYPIEFFSKEGLALHLDGETWDTEAFGLVDHAYGHHTTRVGGDGNGLSFDGTGYLRVDPIGIELIPWDMDFWVEFAITPDEESIENIQLIARIGHGEAGIDIGLRDKKIVVAHSRSFAGSSSAKAVMSNSEIPGGVETIVKIYREDGITYCDINGVRQTATTELFKDYKIGHGDHAENRVYIGMDPGDGDKGLVGSMQYFKMSDPYYDGE